MVKGLIAAVGIILILKQIPHLLGLDTAPLGEMSFLQVDQENTFTELFRIAGDIHLGSVVIGCVSLFLLFGWDFFEEPETTNGPRANHRRFCWLAARNLAATA